MKPRKLSQSEQRMLQDDIAYLARKVNDWQYFNPREYMPVSRVRQLTRNIKMSYNWRQLAIHYGVNIPANLLYLFSPTQRTIWTMGNPYHHMKHPYKQELGAHVIRNVLTWMAVDGYCAPDELTDFEERYFNTIQLEAYIHADRSGLSPSSRRRNENIA